jgi:carbon storage regulator
VLVLTRKSGEAIALPDLNVVVRVLSVVGKTIRIGIEAPRDVTVLREELLNPSTPKAVPAPV